MLQNNMTNYQTEYFDRGPTGVQFFDFYDTSPYFNNGPTGVDYFDNYDNFYQICNEPVILPSISV